MKVLVLGCSGQVGAELMQAQWQPGTAVAGLARPRFDLAVPETIDAALSGVEPDVVVNAAAYTAVDDAEADQARAYAVNAEGPALLAEACRQRGTPLVHLSTDYVFDGASAAPYRETDPVNPINVYGRSKAAGEEAVRHRHPQHVILRTSWVYASHGRNFVRTMLRLARERDDLGIVADQVGSPTSAADIAAAIVEIVGQVAPASGRAMAAPWGTYHFTARGETSWHGLAQGIFEQLRSAGEHAPRLKPIAAADYPSRALRPARSALDCTLVEQTFGVVRPRWQDSLAAVLTELLPARNSLHQAVIGGIQ